MRIALRFNKTPDEIKRMSMAETLRAYSYVLYEQDKMKDTNG